jgi:serine/threonine-protein kinase
VPPSLDAIVLKAMAKGPANRYQSSAEMRGDLVRVLSGQRPAAPMVMTDEDRTSIMGAGRTEVMGGGRHRPSAIADDDYDDYDDEDARKRRKGWIIAGWVVGAIVVIALLAFVLPKLIGGGDSGTDANSVNVPSVVGQKQADAVKALNDAGLSPVPKSVVCGKPDATGNVPCQANQVGLVISTDPAGGASADKGATVTVVVGAPQQAVTVPDLTGKSPSDAQKALTAVGLVLSPTVGNQPTTDDSQLGKVVAQNPAANGSALPGSTVSITVGSQPETQDVPDERGKQYDDAKSDLEGKGFKVTKKTEANQAPKDQVVDMNPSASTAVAPGTTVQLIVSDGSQAQITMPNIINETQAQAQNKLAGLGWTGQFNVQTMQTVDPDKDGQITDQSPEPPQKIDRDQTVNITVYQFIGGTPPSSGSGGFPGG